MINERLKFYDCISYWVYWQSETLVAVYALLALLMYAAGKSDLYNVHRWFFCLPTLSDDFEPIFSNLLHDVALTGVEIAIFIFF